MKNNACFAAMTAAFTVAGAAVGYGLREVPDFCVGVILLLAVMGGGAAALCGNKEL